MIVERSASYSAGEMQQIAGVVRLWVFPALRRAGWTVADVPIVGRLLDDAAALDRFADVATDADTDRHGPTELAELVNQPDDAPVLDLNAAAALLGCSRRTVERRIAAGLIPSVKIGGHRRISRAAVAKHMIAGRPP